MSRFRISRLTRPDLFTAVGLLGVPYTRRGDVRPPEAFARAAGEEEFCVSYFQQPGRAEAEIQADVRSWLRGFYVALDGEAPATPGWFTVPPVGMIRDRLPTDAPLPRWMSETESAARAAEFERNGSTGPLNRYRNINRDWEDLASSGAAGTGCSRSNRAGSPTSSCTGFTTQLADAAPTAAARAQI